MGGVVFDNGADLQAFDGNFLHGLNQPLVDVQLCSPVLFTLRDRPSLDELVVNDDDPALNVLL